MKKIPKERVLLYLSNKTQEAIAHQALQREATLNWGRKTEHWSVPENQQLPFPHLFHLLPPEDSHATLTHISREYTELNALEIVTHSPDCFVQKLVVHPREHGIQHLHYQLSVEDDHATLFLGLTTNRYHRNINLVWDYHLCPNHSLPMRALTGDTSVHLERRMRMRLASEGYNTTVGIGTHNIKIQEILTKPVVLPKGLPQMLSTSHGLTRLTVFTDPENEYDNTVILQDIPFRKYSRPPLEISVPSLVLPDNLSWCGRLDETSQHGVNLLNTMLMPIRISEKAPTTNPYQ